MADFTKQLEKVEIGMTTEEAARILPMPQRIRRSLCKVEDGKQKKEEAWLYSCDSVDARLLFNDDTLVAVNSEEVCSTPESMAAVAGKGHRCCK